MGVQQRPARRKNRVAVGRGLRARGGEGGRSQPLRKAWATKSQDPLCFPRASQRPALALGRARVQPRPPSHRGEVERRVPTARASPSLTGRGPGAAAGSRAPPRRQVRTRMRAGMPPTAGPPSPGDPAGPTSGSGKPHERGQDRAQQLGAGPLAEAGQRAGVGGISGAGRLEGTLATSSGWSPRVG